MLVLLMLVAAMAEVVSLGAVMPFLGVLASPEQVIQYSIVMKLAPEVGITAPDQLLLPVTIFFVLTALASGGVRLLLLWANLRFSYAVGHDLSTASYLRTLYQPYRIHLDRNSSEVIGGVVNKIDILLAIVLQLLTLISALVLTFFIVFALILIDSRIAVFSFVGFGLIYGFVTWSTRRRLVGNSQLVAVEYTRRLKALQEGLGGIRDVLLGGYQPVYSNIYRNADWPMRKAQANSTFISVSPRYLVETMGIVLIVFLAYGMGKQRGEVIAVLPVMGALALGAQRLLPALQQIYNGWAYIASSQASVEDALGLLEQPLPIEALVPPPSPFEFRHEIRFDNVVFQYNHDGPLVLKGLDLSISYGSRIGFVGVTGCGKSTTIDLLMGLLKPTAGRILVDGKPLQNNLVRAWQQIIAHVPQNIFLADTTLAENIAFGEPLDAINMERVQEVARQSHIAEFIEGNPEGYNALVGERGIRLSGGQRQRIGIARALYKQASILVFDEATSALDNTTERAIMDAIDGLGRDLTILIVAHRLSTVRHCDLVVELDQGKVVAQGTYEQLLMHSPTFRKMAQFEEKVK